MVTLTCRLEGTTLLPKRKPPTVHASPNGRPMVGPSPAGDTSVTTRAAAAIPPHASACARVNGLAGADLGISSVGVRVTARMACVVWAVKSSVAIMPRDTMPRILKVTSPDNHVSVPV